MQPAQRIILVNAIGRHHSASTEEEAKKKQVFRQLFKHMAFENDANASLLIVLMLDVDDFRRPKYFIN